MARKVVQTWWASLLPRAVVSQVLCPTCRFATAVLTWVKTLSEGKHLLHRSHPSAFQKTQLVLPMTLLPRVCRKAAAERTQ